MAGLLQQPQKDTYSFSLLPGQVLLNYDQWNVSQGNKIVYAQSGVQVTDFVISRTNEELRITSAAARENAPVDIDFKQFRIATLTGFIQSDTLLADGTLDGKVTLNNITGKTTFTSDLKINDLTVKKDTVGDVHVVVNESGDNTLATNVTITGSGNDVKLSGNYFINPVNNSNFDLLLDIAHLKLKSIEGPSMGMIQNASGEVNGKFSVKGSMASPQVEGSLAFQKAGFNISMLNNYFYVDGDKISVDHEGVRFDNFTILDSSKNKMVLDGIASTVISDRYQFNLTLKSPQFPGAEFQKKK